VTPDDLFDCACKPVELFISPRYNRPVRGFSSLALAVLLLAIASTASGTRSGAAVAVKITRTSCVVSPRTIEAGPAVFRVTNRSGRTASFVVALKRTTVAVGRTVRFAVALEPRRVAYSCNVGGHRVAAGLLRVMSAPQASLEHRIGVREVRGSGELYDRATGAAFVPRGSNYIRLAPQRNASGNLQLYHSTFNVGRYDTNRVEAALRRMATDGYNVVRVFLSEICVDACVGNPATGFVRASYVANVTDFLRRAKSHGIFVILTNEWLPPNTTYTSALSSVSSELYTGINSLILSPQGVAAQERLWTDFIRELLRQQAPMDAIIAYELWNEAVLASDEPPFTLAAGEVTTANLTTYDMSKASDRRRMIDDGFVFLIDRLRQTIQRVDPTALVTMGFFHDTEPNPARRGDNRLVRTRAVIERSTADFVDIHPYADDELTFPQFMQNYGIDGPTAKPIIIGEFGASKRHIGSASQTATALTSWQRQSCAYGIDGWLLWTWDTNEQPDLWNALSDGGVIERALAPRTRPDACA
jgi:hypothetical protein